MKKLTFLLLLACFLPKESIGCFCVQPDLETEIKYADVIFLGVITSIHNNPKVFSPDAPSFVGMSFANLKVIKSAKGLAEYATEVSVFDEHFDSMCGRLFTNYNVGDTILIVGSFLEGDHHFGFVVSHNCRKNVLKKDFSIEESAFVNNDSLWIKAKELNAINYTKESSGVEMQLGKRSEKWFLLGGLILSLCINALLILKITRYKSIFYNSKHSEESELV